LKSKELNFVFGLDGLGMYPFVERTKPIIKKIQKITRPAISAVFDKAGDDFMNFR